MPSSDQCAIGTNGKLLDKSEIVWYNNAKDQVPINPKATTSSSAPKTTTLHAFFNSGTAGTPAVFDAGAHRSSCISKPSKRVLEANNGNPPESSKHPRIAHKQVYLSSHLTGKGTQMGKFIVTVSGHDQGHSLHFQDTPEVSRIHIFGFFHFYWQVSYILHSVATLACDIPITVLLLYNLGEYKNENLPDVWVTWHHESILDQFTSSTYQGQKELSG